MRRAGARGERPSMTAQNSADCFLRRSSAGVCSMIEAESGALKPTTLMVGEGEAEREVWGEVGMRLERERREGGQTSSVHFSSG